MQDNLAEDWKDRIAKIPKPRIAQNTYLSVQQVAEIFGVNDSTVRLWIKDGKLVPDMTTPSGRHKFLPESIQGFFRRVNTIKKVS